MDQHKVISDWIITTQDTIYTLQMWTGLLESWRELGRAEPDDFMEACQQLREIGLWNWAQQAGGHGIAALAEAIGVQLDLVRPVRPKPYLRIRGMDGKEQHR